jgi:hypothetical protein
MTNDLSRTEATELFKIGTLFMLLWQLLIMTTILLFMLCIHSNLMKFWFGLSFPFILLITSYRVAMLEGKVLVLMIEQNKVKNIS